MMISASSYVARTIILTKLLLEFYFHVQEAYYVEGG